jgi:hypothetical protein
MDRLIRNEHVRQSVWLSHQVAVRFDAHQYMRGLAAVGHEDRLVNRDPLGLTDVLVEFATAEGLHLALEIDAAFRA